MKTKLQGITNFYGRTPIASFENYAIFLLIDGKYYIVECGDYCVYSVPQDSPDRGRWMAQGASETAIKYVSRPRSRRAAIAILKKLAAVTA